MHGLRVTHSRPSMRGLVAITSRSGVSCCRQSVPVVFARYGGSSAPVRPTGPPRPRPNNNTSSSRPGQGYNRQNQQRFQKPRYDNPKLNVPINDDIRAAEVRVIGEDKEQLGVYGRNEALVMALDEGLDLIMVSPDADPPVCRLMEFSKYKYEIEKASKAAAKKQRAAQQDTKELKMTPNTDVHDYNVRLRSAQKFLTKGDKVKVSITFKGRERQFQQNGTQMLQRFITDIGELATVESEPRMMGNVMGMVLAPAKTPTQLSQEK